jgi:thymidine kinase
MNDINKPFISVIYGPMFSGKTTKLLELYNLYVKTYGKDKCIAINYILDNRYGENCIISHNKQFIECYCTKSMEEFITGETYNIILNAQYIFINEAQFFECIDKWVLFLHSNLNKTVILCGLDLDYKRDSFGSMMNLLPYASKIYPLYGICQNTKTGICQNTKTGTCENNNTSCIRASRYSHRLINNSEQIFIGSHEYIPLCEDCYNIINY